MAAWIESHQTIWSHAKTRKAAHRLAISEVQVVGHLHALWHWALDHAETGDLTRYDHEDIAIAARWDGDSDAFVQALIDCGPGESAGYLERDGSCGRPEDETCGQLVLHDWWDYAGKLIERRYRDRERKAANRNKGSSQGTHSSGHPTDVQRNSDGRPAEEHVPPRTRDRTEPNRTEHDPTEPPPAHARDGFPPPPDQPAAAHEEGGSATPLTDDLLAHLPAKVTRRVNGRHRRKLEPQIADAIDHGHTTRQLARRILELDTDLGALDRLKAADATGSAIAERLRRATTTPPRGQPPREPCPVCDDRGVIYPDDSDTAQPCPDCHPDGIGDTGHTTSDDATPIAELVQEHQP